MSRSGSGKSTLLCMMGFLDYPIEGDIFLDDVKVTNLCERKCSGIRLEWAGGVFRSMQYREH